MLCPATWQYLHGRHSPFSLVSPSSCQLEWEQSHWCGSIHGVLWRGLGNGGSRCSSNKIGCVCSTLEAPLVHPNPYLHIIPEATWALHGTFTWDCPRGHRASSALWHHQSRFPRSQHYFHTVEHVGNDVCRLTLGSQTKLLMAGSSHPRGPPTTLGPTWASEGVKVQNRDKTCNQLIAHDCIWAHFGGNLTPDTSVSCFFKRKCFFP